VGPYNAPKSAIIGSPHDFTSDTFGGTGATTSSPGYTAGSYATTNTCFFCHIIHKTNTNSSGVGTSETLAPGYMLWNHQLSNLSSYGVYTSDTFTAALTAATVNPPTDLGGVNPASGATSFGGLTVSNLCLSCHDGTVAIASFYESGFGLPTNGSTWNNGHGNGTNMYTGMQIDNLAKSHPVNFVYNSNLAAAAQLTVPSSLNSVDANGAVPLFGNAGFLQCPTCHDPHNGTSVFHGTPVPFARLALATAENLTTGGYCTYCHQ